MSSEGSSQDSSEFFKFDEEESHVGTPEPNSENPVVLVPDTPQHVKRYQELARQLEDQKYENKIKKTQIMENIKRRYKYPV